MLITPEDKDIVLYEGKYADIISENIENVRELTLINDELLYILKGLINPKKDIKKYLNKSGNKVGVKKL